MLNFAIHYYFNLWTHIKLMLFSQLLIRKISIILIFFLNKYKIFSNRIANFLDQAHLIVYHPRIQYNHIVDSQNFYQATFYQTRRGNLIHYHSPSSDLNSILHQHHEHRYQLSV
jgi:hypothetical protein